MVAKAGLGLIGLSAISIGGVAVTKPWLLGMDYMPNWKPLSADKGFSNDNYSSGKFAHKLTKYLVGVTETNKGWWEWSFRRLDSEGTKPEKFREVDRGYDSNTNTKALNQVCKTAYEATTANDFATGNETGKFKKDEVWRYCSPGIKFVTTGDHGTNTIGGDSSNISKLVFTKDDSNDWFWKIRNEDFWSDSGDWSGSTGTNDYMFKKEHTENKNKADRKTIKKLCEEAYDKTKNGSTNENIDALKFCTLENPNS